MFLGNIGRLPPDNATVTSQKMLIFTVIGLIEKRYLKHFRECISPWAGHRMEEKSCVTHVASAMATLFPVVRCK
jgi:hypothetical protein